MLYLQIQVSTDREEIMGLLLGRTAVLNSRKHLHVESVVILQRSDRKADRVEISPLLLAQAAQEAEMLSQNLGRTIRVLGWYHSHPHITVGPSHVGSSVLLFLQMFQFALTYYFFPDVRTQGMYQMMDDDFVGLIFSAFRKEGDGKVSRSNSNEIKVIFIILKFLVCRHCNDWLSVTRD